MELNNFFAQFLSAGLSLVLLWVIVWGIFYYLEPVPGTLPYALIVITSFLVCIAILFRLVSLILLVMGIGAATQNIILLIVLIVSASWFLYPPFRQVIRNILS